MKLPRQAIVLAAGRGQRLRPYTDHTPKPLVPFLNRPLLECTLEALARAGIEQVWLNAWHLSDQLVAWAAARRAAGCDQPAVNVVVEPELLGTGGGLANLAARLDPGPVLVLACDIVADFDLHALAERHEACAAEATMALTARADPELFGPVCVDEDGLITDIVGRLERPGVKAYVNASAHLLEPSFLACLPAAGSSCLVRDGYLPALADGATLAGWVHAGSWAETGTPAALLDAQQAALDGRLGMRPEQLAAGGQRIPGPALVHPLAKLGQEVQLSDGTTVAAGAQIGQGVIVRQCLVAGNVWLPEGTRWEHQIIDSQDTADRLATSSADTAERATTP